MFWQLNRIERNLEFIMTALSDLQDAVTGMAAAVNSAVGEIQALAAQVSAAHAANNDVAVEAAVTSLKTLATNLGNAVSAAAPSQPPAAPTPATSTSGAASASTSASPTPAAPSTPPATPAS